MEENVKREIYIYEYIYCVGFPGGSAVKIHLPMHESQETWVRSLS